jgi:hypothetical protein
MDYEKSQTGELLLISRIRPRPFEIKVEKYDARIRLVSAAAM